MIWDFMARGPLPTRGYVAVSKVDGLALLNHVSKVRRLYV